MAVAGFGFILLNLTFLFDFLFQTAVKGVIKLFTPVDLALTYIWFLPMMQVLFVVIIGFMSWLVFRSRLGVLFKAVYLTVPLSVLFVTMGILLYPWPAVAYVLGSVFSIGVLYYFYRSRQPWLYYYTLILISLSMLLVGLLGVEI